MVSIRYLLDTNTVVYAQRGVASVLQKLHQVGRTQVAIPALVAAELAYGVEKSTRPAHNKRVLAQLLTEFTVLDWQSNAIWHYAHHYNHLRNIGKMIGHMDLLIATQALAEDLIVVTNNTREFERIEGLKLENWVE